MMILQRLFLGLAVLGLGGFLQTAACAAEMHLTDFSVEDAASLGGTIALQPVSLPLPRLDIDERLMRAGDEPIEYEHTFTGNENETIVVYWTEAGGLDYTAAVSLYNAAGELVSSEYYPGEISVDEFDGIHRAFRLPATDEYRLVFSSEDVLSTGGELAGERDFLLKARVASFYERSMMHAINMLDDERYDEALKGFSLAVEQRPEEPMPYVGRLLATGIVAAETLDLTEDEALTPEGLSQLYQSLEPVTQARVLSDIRQVVATFDRAIENGVVATEDSDLDTMLFEDLAVYLETGVLSSALLEMLE